MGPSSAVVRAGKNKAETVVSGAGMRIVKLLVGEPPATVSQLIEATGVTRTAVIEPLNELIAAGFVEKSTERLPGRGRPRHRYRATAAALALLFAGHEGVVIPSIWRALREIGGPDLTQNVLKRVSQAVVESYRPRITGKTPEARLRQLTSLIREEGHLVDVIRDADGQLILRKRTCPFIAMYEETRTICAVDLHLLSAIVGSPVRQIACRHDGAPCCLFAVPSRDGE
jgi:predicted ArsR family transcriptional regulator